VAAEGRLPNLVVDPVMVASSGDRLLEPAAEESYRSRLVPHAVVVTPNVWEAEVLLGRAIRTRDDQHRAARDLGRYGPAAVVVNGGHRVDGTGAEAVDVVWDGATTYELRSPWIDTPNTHGTGCSFAAATAAHLAGGADLRTALEGAKTFVAGAVAGAAGWRLGGGHGPLDHFGWSRPQP
jgi:hydroxymethylpyrimidine/phosphomethylpyrimidine kinase